VDPESVGRAEMYRRMTLIRRFEERCLELRREGFMEGSIHLCAGQEAVPVGVTTVLDSADRVVATYRGHGWALACGVPVTELLAEVCQRAGGINGGRCGSALLNAPGYGFLGENSIVGAGAPIAAGVALAAARQGTGGVAVVSIGDGAMNQGSVNEAMVFAAVNDLPLVIVCENNGWAEMTPTATMTRGSELADRARGLHLQARTIDGCDPVAVRDAAAWAVGEARAGRGPVFLECRTARLWGHYNGDFEHYRPKADAAHAAERDPLVVALQAMVDSGVAMAGDADAWDADARRQLDIATTRVRAMPEPPAADATAHVTDAPASTEPAADCAERGPATKLTYQRAVNAALAAELEARDEVIVYGEDVGVAGGIFGVSRGLQKRFGPARVFDTPIAEAAILGSAVGVSIQGMRPVVEIMWGDFLFVAFDQLVNQAANVRYTSRGELHAPMVVRLQQGATPGACAQHAQSLEALLAHVAGLKVGVIATCADAYAMTRAAIADPDPCVLVEARELYQVEGDVYLDAPAEGVGSARFQRKGGDIAIITWGPMLHRALAAADQLAADGIEVTVLDLRWLSPLDDVAIARAVAFGSGRVVVAHEANLTGGFGAEIVSRIQERHFVELTSPIRRIGAPDTRIPAAPSLQRAVIPDSYAIARVCREVIQLTSTPLAG
jgi:2-oxoisovalerate dehydrogenase E1 component